jgi:hypothetical protein
MHHLFDGDRDPIARRRAERGLEREGLGVKVVHIPLYCAPGMGFRPPYEGVLQGRT